MSTRITDATNLPVEAVTQGSKPTSLREIGMQIAELERNEFLAEENEALVREQRDAVASALYGISPDEIQDQIIDAEENGTEDPVFPPIRVPHVRHRSFRRIEDEETDPSIIDL